MLTRTVSLREMGLGPPDFPGTALLYEESEAGGRLASSSESELRPSDPVSRTLGNLIPLVIETLGFALLQGAGNHDPRRRELLHWHTEGSGEHPQLGLDLADVGRTHPQ